MAADPLIRFVRDFCQSHPVDPRYQVVEMRGAAIVVSDPSLAAAVHGAMRRSDLTGTRVILLPAGGLRRMSAAVAAAGVVPMRSGPGDRQDMVTQLLLGMPVRVLEQSGNWFRVAAPDGYIGWADGPQIRLCTTAAAEAWTADATYRVRHLHDAVREAPRQEAPVMQAAPADSRLVRVRTRGAWVQVRLPDGGLGWIENNDEFSVPGLPLRRAAARTAEHFLGVPYLWGGVSECGFDCSGLIQRIYSLHGIALPRDAADQAKAGQSLGTHRDRWHTGDLVFFGESRVTHVGIYIGRGRVIHARGHVRRAGFNGSDLLFDRRLAGQVLDACTVIPAPSD